MAAVIMFSQIGNESSSQLPGGDGGSDTLGGGGGGGGTTVGEPVVWQLVWHVHVSPLQLPSPSSQPSPCYTTPSPHSWQSAE